MKYTSIDIETTGLDPENCDIIEFAAVVDDLRVQRPIEELPKFQTFILKEQYTGSAFALAMHCEIFKQLARWQEIGIEICRIEDLMANFATFLTTQAGYKLADNGEIPVVVAGKNFSNFDLNFLKKIPNFEESAVKFFHRTLDPCTLYLDPRIDTEPPSTKSCIERAGIDFEGKEHRALDDALAVINLIRNKFPLEKKR